MTRVFPHRLGWLALAVLGATLLAQVERGVRGQETKVDILRIGTGGPLTAEKEDGPIATLRDFIKDETGLKNDITRLKDWRELADKMAKGEVHIGVFQGFEYAWAQEKHAELKPLALAVNVHTYPVAYVVARGDNKAKDFAGLQGQTLALVPGSQRHLTLFLEKHTGGKKVEAFFSKVTSPELVVDALDDVVDGVVHAALVDRTALEAFKRLKPVRAEKLRPVAQSEPFPPPVVAHYGKVLDEKTLDRFRKGLLGAAGKDRGQTTLTLFRLTGFETVPADFGKVLAQARKNYPPSNGKEK